MSVVCIIVCVVCICVWGGGIRKGEGRRGQEKGGGKERREDAVFLSWLLGSRRAPVYAEADG